MFRKISVGITSSGDRLAVCRGGVYGGDGRDRVGGLAVRRGRRREHEEGYAEPESRSPLRGHTWEWGDAPEARLGPTGARSAEGAAGEPGPGEGATLRPPSGTGRVRPHAPSAGCGISPLPPLADSLTGAQLRVQIRRKVLLTGFEKSQKTLPPSLPLNPIFYSE